MVVVVSRQHQRRGRRRVDPIGWFVSARHELCIRSARSLIQVQAFNLRASLRARVVSGAGADAAAAAAATATSVASAAALAVGPNAEVKVYHCLLLQVGPESSSESRREPYDAAQVFSQVQFGALISNRSSASSPSCPETMN